MSADDWVKIIGALAAGIVIILAALERTHRLVNSRMTELLNLTRTSARAAGRASERAGESDSHQ
jgi:hypothetical protein